MLRSVPRLITASVLCSLLAAQQTPVGNAGAATDAAGSSVSGGDRWGASYFPNIEFTNQDGQKVRFFDDCIKGKVVLVSFIYTSCPDACPLETARVAEVQGILGDRVGKDVFFYSITIDPHHDTPEVLKEYSQRYQAGPGWQFLSGDLKETENLRLKLGMFDPEYDQKVSDHSLNILIGNQATGRWQMSGPFENPYILAKLLGESLHNWKQPRTNELNYTNAPEIRQVSEGESIFRTRCASCHAIGGTNTKLARLGPNLFGVLDRRDHAWLKRWIGEPDVMLAEKDPIAMQMFEAYNKVPMPNMRLTGDQIASLFEYFAEETQRVATTPMKMKAEDGTEQEAPHSCCAKKTQAVVGDDVVKTPAPEEHSGGMSSTSILTLVAGALLAVVTAVLGKRRFNA